MTYIILTGDPIPMPSHWRCASCGVDKLQMPGSDGRGGGVIPCACYYPNGDIPAQYRGAVNETQAKKRRADMRLEAARLPVRFKGASLATMRPRRDDEEQRLGLEKVRAWHAEVEQALTSTGVGLMLRGSRGGGKTHLLCGVLHDLCLEGYSALFTNAVELVQSLRPAARDDDQDEHDPMQDLCNVQFLAIDDLGGERSTDWTQEQLYRLVNARYEAKRPTLVATNLDAAELAAAVGQRTLSRLAECCLRITWSNRDYRIRGIGSEAGA